VEFGNPSILGVLDVEKIEGDYIEHFVMPMKVQGGPFGVLYFIVVDISWYGFKSWCNYIACKN
jgi:hypothetical protein